MWYSSLFPIFVKDPLPEVPEGWFVFEMGQSMAHMLWHCQMIYFDDLIATDKKPRAERPRRVWVEECDTPEQAMQGCIDAIKKGDYL